MTASSFIFPTRASEENSTPPNPQLPLHAYLRLIPKTITNLTHARALSFSLFAIKSNGVSGWLSRTLQQLRRPYRRASRGCRRSRHRKVEPDRRSRLRIVPGERPSSPPSHSPSRRFLLRPCSRHSHRYLLQVLASFIYIYMRVSLCECVCCLGS